MENKILAIKGHFTRGEEVIEILEMLGCKNKSDLNGRSRGFYFIDCNNNIDLVSQSRTNFMTFYLEDFLEKYPFKVGDKVQHKGSTSCGTIYVIEKMIWEDNQIKYIIYNPYRNIPKCTVTVTAEDLQPYKEEIWTYYANNDDSKTDITIDGERLIAPNGYTIGNATRNGNSLIVEYIKNKPQYPKTFQECYALKYNGQINLNIGCDILHGAYSEQLECLQNLLICRDIYWEIAGVEMGLSEPWKPDWTKADERKYCIVNTEGNITKWVQKTTNKILAFPTEEMRDAFFENFKDLIEVCKELL